MKKMVKLFWKAIKEVLNNWTEATCPGYENHVRTISITSKRSMDFI